jgi:hypothetical protein
MEITTELLQTLYNRANQFAITKYGSEPDSLSLQSDGTIEAKWTHYSRCGDESEYETITAEDLTADLDEVAEQRRKQEEEARIKREEYEKEQKRLREEREKNDRKRQYETLKKEFGG